MKTIEKTKVGLNMISILMAMYNPNLEWLRNALDSIQNQTFQDFELVIVDDGTTNCSVDEILEKYSFRYKILKNKINLGLPYALNLGLQHCEGEFVARMDADDIMAKDRLEKQYAFLKKREGIVFSNVIRIDDKGNAVGHSECEKLDLKKYLRKSGNCLTHSTLFARKSLILDVGGYNARFTYAQDYELYMRLLDDVNFYVIEKPLLYYRVVSSQNVNKRILSAMYCYTAALMYFRNNRELINMVFFVRRSLSLFKQMYRLVFRSNSIMK